ncbi:Putative acyl-CoA thioester hydrolase [Bordetella petrii]|uniref:Acyl-CoA thioester hydrolase n=1 Tax=Bordetella petrii (strain ATCC BAA-461 / DSM 12804 / CCUG 43448 / CIP 107267 / Se-1111R) TaxID=340100 RepID=A9IG52_BORPD|nr:Putative acyl-CoA thioester hydrolase [Bordetella petrii]
MDLPRHQTAMTVLMTPDTVNFAGNVHGGTILKLLDQVAYACASRWSGQYVVTRSVDQVVFREPIHVGELVTFLASINHTGRSSMEVGVKVLAEDVRSGAARHVKRCCMWRPSWTRSATWPTWAWTLAHRWSTSTSCAATRKRSSANSPAAWPRWPRCAR